ncbi:MAG: tetratricopeptide repeat protein [Bacteroidales bacterium]
MIMKNTALWTMAALMVLLISACNQKSLTEEEQKQARRDTIQRLDQKLFDESMTGNFNADTAKLLSEHFLSFVDQFPKDSLADDYLFKSARIQMSLKNFKEAVQQFSRIEDDYQESEYMPQVLMMKGTIYQDELGQTDEARKAYQQLLDDYPDSEFTKDARILLRYIEQDPEEMLEDLLNKQDSAAVS